MFVPGIHKLALKNTQKVSTLWKICRTKKLKRARDFLNSEQKLNCGTTVDRYLEDETYQMRMHEQGYMQPDMEEL